MAELKIGIVGVGAIGRTHMERINQQLSGAKVVACADANLDFCKSVADKYGIKAFATGEEMIAADEVDAVIVATLDRFHAQYVLASIAAGKPVFCEKPLAPEADTCKKIVEAEMATGKHLVQVGFMRRFDAGYIQLKKAIDSGKYGAPLALHCAHRNPAAPSDYSTQMEVENSMIHEIDVLRWLLGENYETAEVRFGKQCRHAGDNLRDPQFMVLTTESGVRIDVEAFITTGHCYQIKCEVVCEDGILNLPESPTINVCAGANVGHAIDADWSTRFADAYNVEFQQWINATKEGRVDGPTAWDGYAGQVAAAAASKARDTQTIQPVVYDPMPDFYKQ